MSVTPEMADAGHERLLDLMAEVFTDPKYVVRAVYMAMELERRSPVHRRAVQQKILSRHKLALFRQGD